MKIQTGWRASEKLHARLLEIASRYDESLNDVITRRVLCGLRIEEANVTVLLEGQSHHA